jgi:uncharacterized membrane protein YdfJ with MMPL/SSD domain
MSATVIFLVAGTLGAGVADRLDPFCADDPATESVIAAEQLEDAGFFVALIAAAIALTVLPAILTLLGHRVDALTPRFLARRAERDARPADNGFW